MQNVFRRENGTISNIRTFFFIIYNAFTKHRLIPFFYYRIKYTIIFLILIYQHFPQLACHSVT